MVLVFRFVRGAVELYVIDEVMSIGWFDEMK